MFDLDVESEFVARMCDRGEELAMTLTDHHILVTGASSGLGLEVSKRVAKQGLHVARSEAALTGTAKVFKKRDEVRLAAYWRDGDARARLWATTDELLAKRGTIARD